MKRGIIFLWFILDPIYYCFTRLQCLNILRVRLTRYKGRQITLSDGTSINKNDLLVKIHLHNVRIFRETRNLDDFKKTLYLYTKVQESLPELALFILQHNRTDQIKGIIGISSIGKGVKRLGFEIYPLSNPAYILFKRISHYPINFLANSGSTSKKKKASLPKYFFMSKDVLCTKYSTAA